MLLKKSIHRLGHVIFWLVISAAFIGPGTIASALKAGSAHGLQLMWAVTFSIVACIVLQESVARITIASGLTLGEAIQRKFGNNKRINVNVVLTFSIVFGCIAYQAGNVTGALEGVQLVFDVPKFILVLVLFIIAFLLMWNGKIKLITTTLGLLVALMAILFLFTSLQSGHSMIEVIPSMVKPTIPKESSMLLMALIGTTIVPYNLFLGSGLSKDKDLKSTRFGLIFAIIIGGLITVFVLLTGTLLSADFDFNTIAATIENETGGWGRYIFAIGLFAAGFTSSVTAPLAAAITVKPITSTLEQKHGKLSYRLSWISVLLVGSLFSLMSYNPVIIIVMAQAINGLILPFIAISIFYVLNDPGIVPAKFRNSLISNLILICIVGSIIFLGLYHLTNIMINLSGSQTVSDFRYAIAGFLTVVCMIFMIRSVLQVGETPNP